MDIYGKIVEKIIRAQEGIIGPIALEQARKVPGLKVDLSKNDIKFDGKQKEIIEKLIEQYKGLFGPASVEMCRDAVKGIVSEMKADDLPSSLK